MIKCETYNFSDFCNENQITKSQRERRLDDLLEWLTNFYDYDFIKGRKGVPHTIVIKEIYGEYRPLPRKKSSNILTKEKHKNAKEFVITQHLTNEYQLTSKSRTAREWLDYEAYDKYGLTSDKYVAQVFIKPVFDKYAENDGKHIWIYYNTYLPLEETVLDDWKSIRTQHQINDEKAAYAFFKMAEGENIDKELNYYKKALQEFKQKYHDMPIYVESWRLRQD